MGIKTLGFRGEALSSIAAISTLTIKSRREQDTTGTLIRVKDGVILESSPIGAPAGTTIIIENLFAAVPARKKFLKSTATEFRHIVEIVMHFALSYPTVRFFLSHNKRTILDLPKNQDRIERIHKVLGKEIVSHLVPIKQQESYITIDGFLGKPQTTTTSQTKQFLFINGRKVTDKIVSSTVKEAYGNILEPTSLPIFIFFLSIPHELVDVNVHPHKEQIHFINSKVLLESIEKAVRETLKASSIVFQAMPLRNTSITSSYAGTLLKDEVQPWDIKKTVIQKHSSEQFHNLYIAAQTNKGILFIDQHAAH